MGWHERDGHGPADGLPTAGAGRKANTRTGGEGSEEKESEFEVAQVAQVKSKGRCKGRGDSKVNGKVNGKVN
jgi:hypothetical protein